MKFAMRLAFAACLMLVLGLQAQAAQAKSFVLLPFEVHAPQNYSYLSKAVPSTLLGRLNSTGVQGTMGPRKAASAAEARKLMGRADYVLWGTVSVMGNDCTIALNSVDKNGATWSNTAQGPMSALNATVQRLAGAFSSEVLGVAGAAAASRASRSDIIRNETGQQESYLNPQFRYQGNSGDGSRIRSQRIKEEMVDMAVADFNGDGRNEIAILHDHRLAMYVWGKDGRLNKLDEITVSRSNLNFCMRAIDLNRDGAKDLVVATFEEDSNRPYSYFYGFRGNKFKEVAKRCAYFASVINMPPSYQPVLVGQGWDSIKLFAPGVHMMVKQNGTYVLGQRITLPTGANVFNVAWMPGKSGDQLVMLTDDERLKIFQGANQTLIHTTMERFSGSATGMEHYKGMPGLGVDRNYQLPSKYFAPMRLIVADIGHTGEYTLLVNKPVSTAAQIFDRYRYFPQGEIHALFWDGVGLGLKWKTRRIRGSVAAVDLADFNNNGILDLVVGINTSPDLGVGSRQCMVTAYPLDVSQMNPNAPADLSDFEVTPNY